MRKRNTSERIASAISAVLGGLVWLLMSTSATAAMEACGDASGNSQDIESLSASYMSVGEDGLPTITVVMTLCGSPLDSKTIYRLRFDHMAPFYDTADRNDDTVVDENDVCVTTSDTGMMHRGKKDNGPGEIEVVDETITYTIKMADLDSNLMEGDTIYLWADTQNKGIVDRAPDTDESDGCGKPEADEEVIVLLLEEPPEVCPAGVRYDDLDDGTVQDCNTDLIWLKNASCAALGSANWSTAKTKVAALANGACGLSDGSAAGQWRLPHIWEFCDPTPADQTDSAEPVLGSCADSNAPGSLVDHTLSGAPYVNNSAGNALWSEGNPFVGVQSSFYWSGTESNLLFAVRSVNLFNGGVGGSFKFSGDFVWPVRVGQ